MSGRSSAREWALIALLAGCGSSGAAPPAVPEADPAKVTAWAAAMLTNAPTLGMVRDCAAADLRGALPLTQNSLLRLAGKPLTPDPEHADWLNPPELDAAPVQVLLAAAPGSPAARQAAAAVLAAPAALVYRVDNVDAPLALGVKELKRGTVGARIIRYEKGAPVCVQVFFAQNDREVSRKAIEASDRAIVDPKVAAGLRADLTARYLATAPRVTP
ncbi:MAG: hypothetical protein K8W52_10125 [Deltaproteobacteria bacterium]|nr:hypothetical protein [Deltaproteobacteria bacterium]